MASVFEEVAADDAAMSEIRTVVAVNIASNPVVTVELAAIKIALTVSSRRSSCRRRSLMKPR